MRSLAACRMNSGTVDLREVMVHMLEVAGDLRRKRHGRVGADHQLVGVGFGRHGLEDMQEVTVEEQPEVDEVGPRLGGVALARDPELLLVAGKLEARSELRAHPALLVVAGRVDQMAKDLLLRPARGIGLAGGDRFRDVHEAVRRRGEQKLKPRHGLLHRRTTLTVPVLLALSAARITSRCSPLVRPARSRTNFSRGESITPSAASIGIQALASSEYSQRRSELAASAASHSTCAVAPSRRTVPMVSTGGVLSIITGELTSVASRAEAGGLASRSLAITRKKYLPSASTSASKVSELSCMLERSTFHCDSSSPRK